MKMENFTSKHLFFFIFYENIFIFTKMTRFFNMHTRKKRTYDHISSLHYFVTNSIKILASIGNMV